MIRFLLLLVILFAGHHVSYGQPTKTSENGIKILKDHEGKRNDAYPDQVGVWTICYGHTTQGGPPPVHQGMKLSDKECEDLLKKDLGKFEAAVNRLVKVPLTQNQFDALVSFTFNQGEGTLGGSDLLKKLNDKDYNGAANEFKKYNKPGQGSSVVVPGLVVRRQKEEELFRKP